MTYMIRVETNSDADFEEEEYNPDEDEEELHRFTCYDVHQNAHCAFCKAFIGDGNHFNSNKHKHVEIAFQNLVCTHSADPGTLVHGMTFP